MPRTEETADRIVVYGLPASPYTRKMLAALRYRHIPYRVLWGLPGTAEGLPKPKVPLLPSVYLPQADGSLEPLVDSTPILRRLESERSGRSVIPPDPATAFLDYLLEDYADEWLTKALFHYRWANDADIDLAGSILPRWDDITASETQIAERKAQFSARQIGRLSVVGSNEITGPLIEESYARFLRTLDAHLRTAPFAMGSRPGACDFALYGQLTQLTHFDPTPMDLTLRIAPRVYAWCDLLDDLSGLEPNEGDWIDGEHVPDTLRALLAELGRTYVPVMLANAQALQSGADRVELRVDGRTWTQAPFPYQGKCVAWIRERYGALPPNAKATVDRALAGTGCEPLLAA